MRKVVKKIFWAWQYDKEEAWLRQMALEGWELINVAYCKYTFEPCEPGKFGVRIELLEKPVSSQESKEYIQFMEDAGVKCVGSVMRWVYFKKETSEDPSEFEIFSERRSKLKQLNLILSLLSILMIVNIVIGISNFGTGLSIHSTFNVAISFLSFGVALFLGLGALKVKSKKEVLKRESEIFE